MRARERMTESVRFGARAKMRLDEPPPWHLQGFFHSNAHIGKVAASRGTVLLSLVLIFRLPLHIIPLPGCDKSEAPLAPLALPWKQVGESSPDGL